MIAYVEQKEFDFHAISELLVESKAKNHWANFGPLSIKTEQKISEIITLPKNMCVIICSSGTVATHALAALHCLNKNKEINWTISSYGFPSSKLGILSNSTVVDCDENGMLDISKIPEDVEGLLVTNIFGTCNNLSSYKDFCKERDIPLIIDSATSIDATSFNIDSIISLHATKPHGAGEGGAVITTKDNYHLIKDIINFKTKYGTNGKISDISCAFIYDRLDKFANYNPIYNSQFHRVFSVAKELGFKTIGVCPKTPACVPLVSPKPVTDLSNEYVVLQKYYRPLADTPVAQDLYSKMVNFPCHPGIQQLTDSQIEEVLQTILRR